jgi:glycosyltransferase involved in cell wall biosynthesis
MGRGLDTTLFDPAKQDRSPGPFMLGFVGRLTVEKNVRLLFELEKALLELGCKNFRFRFLIVGQGVLEPWLREICTMVLLPVYLRVMRSPAPTLTWRCSLSPRARYLRQRRS